MRRRTFLKSLAALFGIAVPGGVAVEKFGAVEDPEIEEKSPIEAAVEHNDEDDIRGHPYLSLGGVSATAAWIDSPHPRRVLCSYCDTSSLIEEIKEGKCPNCGGGFFPDHKPDKWL